MFNLDSSLDAVVQRHPSKRKLDDYGVSDDDILSSVRARKVDSASLNYLIPASDRGIHSPSGARVSDGSRLQFFVRMISEGKTLVVQANREDTVEFLHERIHLITGIPAVEQRLIYRGKQLQLEQSLAECCIQNDAGLQLVGRMRSTEHPLAWQTIDHMLSLIWQLCRDHLYVEMGNTLSVSVKLLDFLMMTPRNDVKSAAGHLQILLSSSTPAALLMLYSSPHDGNKELAADAIRQFLTSCCTMLPKHIHPRCAPIVLEFCKLLGMAAHEDALYLLCRSTLGSLVETVVFLPCGSSSSDQNEGSIATKDIIPFLSEIASRLSKDLVSKVESPTNLGPLRGDVRDFSAFLLPLRTAIYEHVGFRGPISLPMQKNDHPYYEEEIEFLHDVFNDLLIKMDQCLQKMEESLKVEGIEEDEILHAGCSHYLSILKELNSICRLYKGGEERFWNILRIRKYTVCALIRKYAKRSEDNRWILEHKDVTDFESRRHLVMMLLPDGKDEYEELHEMLIDRSQLLEESFEYIGRAESDALRGGLFLEFKNEEATGPGVLREWFLLVSQAIFNTQNALFVACPNDRRRFYPNPASKVDPLHLEYFGFSGRIVALALMHKVHVGIVLDRVFFLQLAGRSVSLDDIQDADPDMYHSCRKILEMDADFIDSDELGLTFVTEFEELGSRRIVELCPRGKNRIVSSGNRKEYVDRLIQHRFVSSISEQVYHFSRGFADIMCDSSLQKLFFQTLDLEDLDLMLHGSRSDINVEDWKAHTEYNGYSETDDQISWFWEAVGRMSAEQRQVLLFFWTSVKYLPVDGFGGLASRLHIYKSSESQDRLPTSHTCFYRLSFPPYSSRAVMQFRLQVVTEEHVGYSFGTW